MIKSGFIALSFMTLSLFAATPSSSSTPTMPTSPNTMSTPAANASPCAQSSPVIQEFASQLSTLHQQIFCVQFDGDQRAEVLAMLLSKSPKYVGMTPDEAVEMVLKNSRMNNQKQMPCAPAASKQQARSSRYSDRRKQSCASGSSLNM